MELTQFQVLSPSDPASRVIPPPSAVESDGLATLPSSIFLSATSTVVLETVVVVPLTVRFPPTTTLLAMLVKNSLGTF